MNQTRILSTRNLVLIGMLGSLSAVLMLFKFPLPFAPAFYTVDFSEVPVLIGAFALGPITGILIEFVKILINFVLNGTYTAGIGEFANFLSGAILVFTAASIYTRKKTKTSAIIGLFTATIVMSIASCFINYFITLPAYFTLCGYNWDMILGMVPKGNSLVTGQMTFLLLAVLPFNIVKCGLSSLITLLLYKPLSPIIKGQFR